MNKVVLKLDKITKGFPGVLALNAVNLELRKNEVVGLVGENGAGKSTLFKILTGIYKPDSGKYILNGEEVEIGSFLEANKKGIGMVFQEQSLLPNLSIAENLFLGSEDQFVKYGRIDKKSMYKESRRLLKLVDLDYDPALRTGKLNFSHRQMIEIAKALRIVEGAENSVILFDEPTSVLQDEEIEKLFNIINRLKKKHTIVFVSHRLDEVLEISDRVYVLKDGKNVTTKEAKSTTEEELHQLMVGRNLQSEYYKINKQINVVDREAIFEVQNLNAKDYFSDCSFKVRQGEILGICGVEGSGKESLCRGIFGLIPTTGSVYVDSQKIKIKSPVDAVNYGIGYIPKERLSEGIIPYLSVIDNMNLSNLKNIHKHGIVHKEVEKDIAEEWINKLRIKTPDDETLCSSLSGGNQQKVVLSKWLNTQGIKVLILDHPTRGIDVGAKEEIYELIREVVEKGISIILTSDTLEELIGLSNTIHVMKDGVIQKTFSASPDNKPNQEQLVTYMV